MAIPRRALLATPFLAGLAQPARAAMFAMLRPHFSSELSLVPLPGERLAFRAAGLDPAIALPGARAHVAQLVPIADRQLALLVFGADPSADSRLDLAAFIGWDGVQIRVLALEVWAWQAPSGAHLGTRLQVTGDRTRLLLLRDAAAPRGARPWLREGWTDTMLWHEGDAFANDPPRAPPPESWQFRFEGLRSRVVARLASPCQDISDDLIAMLAPADLPPA